MIYSQLRAHQLSAIAGATAWLLVLAFLPIQPPTILWISQLLLLAVLVLVPLTLGLVVASHPGQPASWWRLAIRAQPFAAAAVVAAFLLPAGILAGVLALSWLLFAGI